MIRLIREHKVNFILFLLSCAFIICFWSTQMGKNWRHVDSLEEIQTGWYYFDAGNKIEVTLPAQINYTKTDSLTLYNDELDNRGTSQVLSTYAAMYNIKMYSEDKELFETRDFGLPRNDAVLSKELCFAHLAEESVSKQFSIIYYDENGEYNIPEVYVGTWKATLMDLAIRNLYTIIITLFIIVVGILVLLLSAFLHRQGNDARQLCFLGVFLFSAGVWCLSDSAIAQMFTGYGNTIYYIDFYGFMIMPIPMLYYLTSYRELKKNKFFLIAAGAFYGNIIVQSALAYFGIFTFFEMLFVTHILLLVMVVVTLYILYKEYKARRKSRIKNLISAFMMLGVFSVISLFMYRFLHFAAYQRIFQTGLALFIGVLMYSVVSTLVESLKYRSQVQTYRTLSQRDNLTKLQNRRAFDLVTHELVENSDKYKDVTIIYMDINNLKHVNDTYGHLAGDELILGAAKCIDHAFSDKGYCFRFGGDEFCALITSRVPEDEIKDALQKEVDDINARPDFANKLTIAIGCSYLMDEKGETKELADWIEEADSKMYADKKKKKEMQKTI